MDARTSQRIARACLGEPLPAHVAAELRPLDRDDAAAVAVLRRMLRHVRRARVKPADLTELFGRWAASIAAQLVPTVRSGVIPPFTFGGRHRELDEWLARTGALGREGASLLDVGAGFPPTTATEAAERFPRARITALEPAWPADVVNGPGWLALFDAAGELRYLANDRTIASARVRHAAALRRAAIVAFRRLSRAGAGDTLPGGVRRTRDPLEPWRRPNLDFVAGGIGEPLPGRFDVVRCMNVLPYYRRAFRARALRWFEARLRVGGVLVEGVNHAGGMETRYSVRRRRRSGLGPPEIAFSLDHVRPLGAFPWVELAPDPELRRVLACVRALRADAAFVRGFDARLDELLAASGLCRRDAQGTLRLAARDLPPARVGEQVGAVVRALDAEGWVEAAARSLRAAGLRARRNEVGHLAVEG